VFNSSDARATEIGRDPALILHVLGRQRRVVGSRVRESCAFEELGQAVQLGAKAGQQIL